MLDNVENENTVDIQYKLEWNLVFQAALDAALGLSCLLLNCSPKCYEKKNLTCTSVICPSRIILGVKFMCDNDVLTIEGGRVSRAIILRPYCPAPLSFLKIKQLLLAIYFVDF